MRFKTLIHIVFSITVFHQSQVVLAAEQTDREIQSTHLELALELVDALGINEQYETNRKNVEARLQTRLEHLQVDQDKPYYARVESFKSEVNSLVLDVFDWEADRLAFGQAYANNLSEQEIASVLVFVRSGTFQKFAASQTAFQEELLALSQKRNQRVSSAFADAFLGLRADLLASAE